MNYHSIQNQRIIGQLVEREVVHCASYLMSHLIKHMEDTEYQDELMNLCESSDWESAWDESGKKLVKDSDGDLYIVDGDYSPPEREEGQDDDDYQTDCDLDLISSGEAYDGDEDDYQELCQAADIEPHRTEVYEHWIVSDFLGRKLKERGETVEEVFDFTIWGRTCSGQAILLDYVIGTIAESMGILEGQEHSWADK